MAELTKEERVLRHITSRALAGFFSRIQVPRGADDCAIWTGYIAPDGYGKIAFQCLGRTVSCKPYRVMYTYAEGPIPAGLQLDHLCRVPACVRPDHLEPVTGRENQLRSPITFATLNLAKTECIAGHPYDDANTFMGRRVDGRLYRACRECSRIKHRKLYARRKAATAR